MSSKKRFFKRKAKVNLKTLNKKVQQIQNKIEIKEKNFVQALITTGGADQGFILNGLFRGAGNGNRVGEKVYMKQLKLTIRIKQKNNAILSGDSTQATWNTTPLDTQCRVIVFINKQNNLGSSVNISEILASAAGQSEKIRSEYDFKFVDSKFEKLQYKILFDRVFYTIQGTIHSDRILRIQRRLNHKVSYTSSNNGDATDIINNALRVVFIPENDNIDFAFSSVLYYSDT